MGWMRFLRRAEWDRERSREIDSYLEIETAENVAQGMTAEEAAQAARRKFGNAGLVREEIYRMNSLSSLESIAQDLRYGIRQLTSAPGFAFVAILSLALGIGANTAIFQLLDAIRLRSLPVPNPQELAEVKIVGGNAGLGINQEYGELTRPMWEEIRRVHPAFSGVFAWSKQQFTVGEGSAFRLVKGIAVSGDFFRVLGVEPWKGRVLQPSDEHACNESTAVVSYAYWQSELGGREVDATTKLLINGELKQIAGVVPPWFTGVIVGETFDIALPFCQPKELQRNVFALTVMGRLRPGWTVAEASTQLAAQSPGIMEETEITGYDAGNRQTYRRFRLGATPASSGVSGLRQQYDSSLLLLLAISGLVLLIACFNLANLMLARATTREREIAVRLALGCGRFRILRQLLIESMLLAGLGAGLGVGLAAFLSRALVLSIATANDSVHLPIGIDWRVLLFAAAAAALTCLVFGAVPAIRASGGDPITALRSGGRGNTAGRERFSFQRGMVVAQISVSLVLLVGALLFVHSFQNLVTFDPGVREKGITIAWVGFANSHVSRERTEEFKHELLDDVRSIPGVLHAATTTVVPLMGSSWTHVVSIGNAEGASKFTWVSPGYFATMGIPLLQGRDLNENDTSSSQHVAVVNQTFVRTLLNGADPIGRTMRTHAEPGYPSTVYEIVGTIADTGYACLRCGTPPMAFAPASQSPNPQPYTAIVIHSDEPADLLINSVKQRIGTQHPEVLAQYRVYQAEILDSLVRDRLLATLSGLFGVLAALLAMAGLYGVISYVVTRRRNEIGIRLALGATGGQVVGGVMREAALLLIVGVLLGTALSLLAGRSAGSLLFGLKPYDPATLAAAIGLLGLMGAAASFLPAQRAAKLDPMTALRCD